MQPLELAQSLTTTVRDLDAGIAVLPEEQNVKKCGINFYAGRKEVFAQSNNAQDVVRGIYSSPKEENVIQKGEIYWLEDMSEERIRQRLQNLTDVPEYTWGKSHASAMEQIMGKYSHIHEVFHVGVGADAEVIIHDAETYKDRLISVGGVEVISDNVRLAREKIGKMGLGDRIEIIQGNAATADIPQSKGGRLIRIHAVLQHLTHEQQLGIMSNLTSKSVKGDVYDFGDMYFDSFYSQPKTKDGETLSQFVNTEYIPSMAAAWERRKAFPCNKTDRRLDERVHTLVGEKLHHAYTIEDNESLYWFEGLKDVFSWHMAIMPQTLVWKAEEAMTKLSELNPKEWYTSYDEIVAGTAKFMKAIADGTNNRIKFPNMFHQVWVQQ